MNTLDLVSRFCRHVGTLRNSVNLVFCVALVCLVILPLSVRAQTKTTPILFAIQFGTTPPVQISRLEGGDVLPETRPGVFLTCRAWKQWQIPLLHSTRRT
jgi:hypothetical protein